MYRYLPHFLIIGAMKAGTTTLYRDLMSHPDVFMPEDKEPRTLIKFGDDLEAAKRDYRSLFRAAKLGQILGEATTSYTKRPDFEGIAERALKCCGLETKIIYLYRDPIERIISHYKHEFGNGIVNEQINEAVLKYPRYANYSRYEWQLEPWLECFGNSNVLALDFEEFIKDRRKIIREICTFIGADPDRLPDLKFDRAFNSSEEKLVLEGAWRKLVKSRFYQRNLKPLAPRAFRTFIAERCLKRAAYRSETLTHFTKSKLMKILKLN